MEVKKILKIMNNFEYKKMKYYSERIEREILCEGEYKGYKFYILNFGTHPTAYIKIPPQNKLFFKDYDDIDNIDVHGGLTYSENYLFITEDKKIKGWFIGWDYAHYGDYVGYLDEEGQFYHFLRMQGNKKGKKWTTKEILQDCFSVIDQIIELGD